MKKRAAITLALLALLGACTTVSQGGYYWGAYSPTYFEMVKNPSPETTERRLEALTDIIEVSADKGLRVPPGIYAERGMMFIETDKTRAMSDFQAEIAAYPEAEPFIERLVARFAD